MKSFFLVLIAAVAVPVGAQEAGEESEKYFPRQLSARDLLTACVSSSLTAIGRARQRYCLGFVSGVEEAVRLLQSQGPGTDTSRFCVPAGTTARELANAFVRHASEPGKELDRPSAPVVLEALVKRYPC